VRASADEVIECSTLPMLHRTDALRQTVPHRHIMRALKS
jgi:hypothetical protein